jgi:hypothetical protein
MNIKTSLAFLRFIMKFFNMIFKFKLLKFFTNYYIILTSKYTKEHPEKEEYDAKYSNWNRRLSR